MLEHAALHPSTEGDDLALAAVNLLAMSCHALKTMLDGDPLDIDNALADDVAQYGGAGSGATDISRAGLLQVRVYP